MRILIVLMAGAMLAGCATPAEKSAQVQREVEQMIEVYGPSCEKLGYTRDSDRWRDCILRLDSRDIYQRSPGITTTSCIRHRGFFQCSSF